MLHSSQVIASGPTAQADSLCHLAAHAAPSSMASLLPTIQSSYDAEEASQGFG